MRSLNTIGRPARSALAITLMSLAAAGLGGCYTFGTPEYARVLPGNPVVRGSSESTTSNARQTTNTSQSTPVGQARRSPTQGPTEPGQTAPGRDPAGSAAGGGGSY